MLRTIAAVCAQLGARAVIAHCGLLTEAQARSLPGDPLVRDFWPQQAVLARVQAAIVHGGFNTVLDALSAGVPMVVVPIAFEQPGTSARLKAAGAAIVVPRRRLTQRRLRVALDRILNDPAFAIAARRFADQLSGMDGAGDAADRILSACRNHRQSPEPAIGLVAGS
jgi:UDP:flavonoid glycosyltransferase YjiC (YdhE family)